MADPVSPTRNLRLTPAPATRPEQDDELSTELDAIITIGRALSHIPDAETRARVLRWAIERFGIDVAPTPEPDGDLDLPRNMLPTVEAPEIPAETLNVEGLSDFFPATDEEAHTGDQGYSHSRSREPKPAKPTASNRLRDVLHWMGI
ncbi:MAG TPA: hypothetical protein VGY57_15865 [Vicinamibacterales bacterium]|nr:hypothetical protein [Vicinamibacterales bacterium]